MLSFKESSEGSHHDTAFDGLHAYIHDISLSNVRLIDSKRLPDLLYIIGFSILKICQDII